MIEQQAADFMIGFLILCSIILLLIFFAHYDTRQITKRNVDEFMKRMPSELITMPKQEIKLMVDFYEANKNLDDVPGNVLPPIGATVQIHLASRSAWVEHTVVGYYVTIAQDRTYQINVRVIDENGYENARYLGDIVWNKS